MNFRTATSNDCDLLAELNHQLIRDEGHRNKMTVPELEQRMKGWLAAEYTAVLLKMMAKCSFTHFFVSSLMKFICASFLSCAIIAERDLGGLLFEILRTKIWPANKRLTVDALVNNHAAIAFWRAMGYQDYSLKLEILPAQNG